MFDVLIPAALQINMDDVGWWCGRDDRKIGGPSRTAMPRKHCVADYQAIADLGAALNMQISCAFVLGEWDMDNRLSKDVLHFSHYGDKWDNASHRNREDLEKAAEIVRNSPYIDIALHGLYHGYYKPEADFHDYSDFWYPQGGRLHMVPEKEIRNRIEHYLRICEEYDFRKKITTYVPPSARHRPYTITEILKDYGIRQIFTLIKDMDKEAEPVDEYGFDRIFVENGIMTVDMSHFVPWDAVDMDFDPLPPSFGVLSTHWPNFLNVDPQKHGQSLERIVKYFKKCSETFGIILSRNAGFAASQELYKKYVKTAWADNAVVFDLSQVPEAGGRSSSFFISAKTQPKGINGGCFGELERHADFCNYEIKPHENFIKIYF